MTELEVVVADDGRIVIPASAVAERGFKAGEHVAVSIAPRARKASRGLLRGRLPNLSDDALRLARELAVEDFEATRSP